MFFSCKKKKKSSKNNMNKKVRMRGFMCQSPASTAVVCMPEDMRGVIMPRSSRSILLNQHSGIGRNVKYSRVVDESGKKLSNETKKNSTSVALVSHARQKSGGGDCQPPPQLPRKQLIEQPKSQAMVLHPSLCSDVYQVVVLKVSIHCHGCAAKLKKHLSKMEGVTSFTIDLDMKRVTIMGHVSPDGVLESVSRVKRAEFWTC